MFEIGDQVTITIPKENREWGYNPCPDGTQATVVGFSEITHGRINGCGKKPGVYTNTSWVKVQLSDNSVITEFAGRLNLTNAELRERRLQLRREALRKDNVFWDDIGFLRDLPETEFWEWDIVEFKGQTLKVVGINYENIGQKCYDGCTDMPIYRVGGEGWYQSPRPEDLKLVKRGNVWKHYHNEPIQFDNIEDEASLHRALGLTMELRNPGRDDLYSWTKEEVLEAIRGGMAHGLTVHFGFFGSGMHTSAIRFQDENLGKRVAQKTLEGFK